MKVTKNKWAQVKTKQELSKTAKTMQFQSGKRESRANILIENFKDFIKIEGMKELLDEEETIQWVLKSKIEKRPNLATPKFENVENPMETPFERLVSLLQDEKIYLKNFTLVLIYYGPEIAELDEISEPIEMISLPGDALVKWLKFIFEKFIEETADLNRSEDTITKVTSQVTGTHLEGFKQPDGTTKYKKLETKTLVREELKVQKPEVSYNKKSELWRCNIMLLSMYTKNIYKNQVDTIRPFMVSQIPRWLSTIFRVNLKDATYYQKQLLTVFKGMYRTICITDEPDFSIIQKEKERLQAITFELIGDVEPVPKPEEPPVKRKNYEVPVEAKPIKEADIQAVLKEENKKISDLREKKVEKAQPLKRGEGLDRQKAFYAKSGEEQVEMAEEGLKNAKDGLYIFGGNSWVPVSQTDKPPVGIFVKFEDVVMRQEDIKVKKEPVKEEPRETKREEPKRPNAKK